MLSINEAIKQILKITFEDKTPSLSDEKELVSAISSEYIQILNIKENIVFIDNGSELDYIFIQVKGMSYVTKYTLDGRRIIAATFGGAQIFGLIEAINGSKTYMGTVITLSDCILVKVKKEKFLQAMYSDLVTASITIKCLADFSTYSIETIESKAAISSYENLIIYLYNKTLGKKLPHAISDKKEFIADLLQINKRTLYRYLDKLSKEGIISRSRQDINISKDNLDKIEKLYESIHNFNHKDDK